MLHLLFYNFDFFTSNMIFQNCYCVVLQNVCLFVCQIDIIFVCQIDIIFVCPSDCLSHSFQLRPSYMESLFLLHNRTTVYLNCLIFITLWSAGVVVRRVLANPVFLYVCLLIFLAQSKDPRPNLRSIRVEVGLQIPVGCTQIRIWRKKTVSGSGFREKSWPGSDFREKPNFYLIKFNSLFFFRHEC